jgi:ABC-2 type transport system permease protein
MEKILFLLQLEWLKVRTYRPFWVLSGAFVLIMGCFMPFIRSISFPKEVFDLNTALMFPNVWHNLAYWGNWAAFFAIGFLSVLSITNEFEYKTLRQSVISGLSRTDVFLSKLLFIISLSAAATLIYTLFALVLGLLTTETIYWSRVSEGIGWIGNYFMMCLGFASFALFVGTLLRRSGISLFLFLTWEFFIEPILRYAVHKRLIISNESVHYYPMKAFDNLVPLPIPTMLNNSFKGAKGGDFPVLMDNNTAMVVSILYIGLVLYGTYYLLKNRDL